jgi:cholesterol oxidase
MDRREFGRRVLQASAALGLRSISASRFAALGLPLAACAAGSRGPQVGVDAEGRVLGIDPGGEADAYANLQQQTGSPGQKSVIIVGSGYGSSVTALRLVERGIPVTILERGRLWNNTAQDGKIFCSTFSPDGRAMWFKPRIEAVVKKFFGFIDVNFATAVQAGVIDVSGPPSMRVFRGAGVGGGSLVNLAVFVTPEREILQRALPDADLDAMYRTYYPRAKATLRCARVTDRLLRSDIYQYARVGMQQAKDVGYEVSTVESGYDYNYMQQEVDGTVPVSAAGGEAGFGNNYGKNSLDKTYLADAMGTGLLTILPLHEVKRITPGASGGFVLDVNAIDIDGKVLTQVQLPCTHLFVGAGSMGSTEMMVRSRDRGDLPDLSPDFGTLWGPNSDIFVARDNPIWSPTGAIQCGVPATTFKTRDQNGRHLFSMIIPMPVGLETWVGFNIVMADNPEAGHFIYDRFSDTVDLKWETEQNAPAVASAKFVFDKINVKAGSNYSGGNLFGGPTICDNATYHPVGGCPMGKATDAFGRVPQYPGLYVVDSSLVHVGLCGNPALTTAALAERNIDRVLAEDFKV